MAIMQGVGMEEHAEAVLLRDCRAVCEAMCCVQNL